MLMKFLILCFNISIFYNFFHFYICFQKFMFYYNVGNNLRKSCFIRKHFRAFFYHFFFACFHFLMFSFLQTFSGAFSFDCICSLHCFFTVVVTVSATDLREHFLISEVFYLTLLSCFYQGFPGPGSSALKVVGLPTEARNTDLAYLFV